MDTDNDEKSRAISEQMSLLNFLRDTDNHYFSENTNLLPQSQNPVLRDEDIVLFRIDEMTFEDKAPRKEALENVLSAIRIEGVNFFYLLMGNSRGVKFYYGLSKDPDTFKKNPLHMREIGTSILKATLEGNFRGCRIKEINPDEKTDVLSKMRGNMRFVSRLEGVPGTIQDNEQFQSVDRLVDVMRGSQFCLLIVAQAIQKTQVAKIEQTLNQAYSKLNTEVKYSRQLGVTEGSSQSISVSSTTNESHSDNTGKNEGTSVSDTSGTSKNHSKGTNSGSSSKTTTESGGEGSSQSHTEGSSNTTQESHTDSRGTSQSSGMQDGTSKSSSSSESREYLNKCAQEWIKYCDDVVFPRLDYSRGRGLFQYAFYGMTYKQSDLIKLENTAISLYSGKQGNRVPLRAFRIEQDKALLAAAKYFQLPRGVFKKPTSEQEKLGRSFLSQDVSEQSFTLSNWISTNELSMIAGLPQKEVIGMRLRELVEFGLNYQQPLEKDQIYMGNLVQDGNELITAPVSLDKNILDKHIFVTGVTGSGKTTTCQRILLQSNLPFLVVEPAKTEYRILKNESVCKDLLVFTLGNDEVAPFRLNPFEFMPGENITSHVDMIKASMNAAFEMEAAIPQLLESAIYRCYERKGWNIQTNQNPHYCDPFAPGCCSFPTLSDLLDIIPDIVREQGFDQRLYDEYVGSIRARLQSLTLGAKGMMLDTPRSVNFDTLLDCQVVLELENIRSGDEKALIMGFVLSAFNEAVRERYLKERAAHPHILLVEEAHRLLSRVAPGENPNKKLGVEIFSDMLAEIRKYGECLIISDQIPNKLAPDVLKNTNTKIVHRIFAQDDKEAVGSTIALTEDQKKYLSNLEVGQAVLFSDNYGKAILTKIKEQSKTSVVPLEDEALTEQILQYYIKEPTFCPAQNDLFTMQEEDRREAFQYLRMNLPVRILEEWHRKQKKTTNREYSSMLRKMLSWGVYEMQSLAIWISEYYLRWNVDMIETNIENLKHFFAAYAEDNNMEIRKSEIGNIL